MSAEEDSAEEDEVASRRNPAVAQRIVSIQKKIYRVLDEIAYRLNKIPLPDGEKDCLRREQRFVEFSVRFSRNYLYEVERLVGEIRRHLSTLSPEVAIKRLPNKKIFNYHWQAIEQKLITSYQLILNALVAYSKHIPNSTLKGHPGKLKELINILTELQNISGKFQVTSQRDHLASGDSDHIPSLNREVQEKCFTILSNVKASCSDNDSLATRTTLHSCRKAKPTKSNKNLHARYSMYTMEHMKLPRCTYAKRMRQCQCKIKKSTSVLNLNNSRNDEECRNTLCEKELEKEKLRRRTAKIHLPPKEDDIKTMMDSVSTFSDAESNLTYTRKLRNGMRTRYKDSVRRSGFANNKVLLSKTKSDAGGYYYNDNNNYETDQQLSSMVPLVAEIMSLARNEEINYDPMKNLYKRAQKYQSEGDVRQIRVSTPVTSGKLSKCQNRGESANKNVKLICIKEDSSFARSSSTSSMEEPKRQFEEKKWRQHVHDIPESSIDRLEEYRKQFGKCCSSSAMYFSNTQNKPWDVVAGISDLLVDELLKDVSKELEIDDVIKRMFELEFKEF